MSNNTSERSEYYSSLNDFAKKRYEQKLSELKIPNDPLVLDESKDFDLTTDVTNWPDISFADIFCYLINYPGQYSKGSLKAYKSLEAYKYVISGLVFNVHVKSLGDKFLVVARVRHGQSQFSKTPNHIWLGIAADGSIINAHCTCMAGLGEACSHIGAVMFYLQLTSEYTKRNLKGQDACTSMPCSWLPPSVKEVSFARLSEINFQDPKRKFQNVEEEPAIVMPPSPKYPKHQQVAKPTNKEKETFFDKLASTGQDIAILRLIPPHNNKLVSIKSKLQNLIFNFYNKNYETCLYHELIQESVRTLLSLKISQEDVDLVEKHTREQAKSDLWFQARAGVITASRFKACCHTDLSQPSKSLILQVCYPQKNKFSTEATRFGCKNEKVALSNLEIYLKNEHKDVKMKESGLIRSCEFPFLGATPDSMMSCSCCEQDYVIEIKCPFKCTKQTVIELAKTDKSFCMEYRQDAKCFLKRDHAYYYQVQLQMLLSNVDKCYFFVYGDPHSVCELIHKDIDFLTEKVPVATKFFVFAILPELIGRWYSKSHIAVPEIENKEDITENVCTCRSIMDSAIIICSDKSCVVKKYHTSCLGIEHVPKKKWFCPYCSRKKSRSRKKT